MEMLIDILPFLMFAVLVPLMFTGYPVAFVLGGVGLMFWLLAVGLGLENDRSFFLVVSRIFGGVVAKPLLVAIPMFIYMGTVLERSGIARDLLLSMQLLTRRIPGGLALSVTLIGVVLAATTGIIGASVVMMTLMALPVMLEAKYDPALASGTIAASGTLGILLPPSIMLVVMADLLSTSAGGLFMAAIGPSLLLAVLYALYIFMRASLNPKLAPRVEAILGVPQSAPEKHESATESATGSATAMPAGAMPRNASKVSALAARADTEGRPEQHTSSTDAVALMQAPSSLLFIKSFFPPVALIALVLGSIFGGWATPTEASGIGAFGATVLALTRGKISVSDYQNILEKSALTTAMLFALFIGATAFSYVFSLLGGHDAILHIINVNDTGPWLILAALMILVFVLGFFFDWIEITLIVLPVFAPVIAHLNFSGHLVDSTTVTVWFAVLMAVNLQTSFLTPPFGFALFYMKGAAGNLIKLKDIYRGIVPFVILQILALIAVLLWPDIALYLPREMG